MRKDGNNAGLDAEFDMLAYSYSYAPGASAASAYGERSLWCAVIQQAFADIAPNYFCGKANDTRRKRAISAEKNAALHWLLQDTKDFYYVCSLAGVSPSVMRRAAKHFMVINGYSVETAAGSADTGA